MYSIPSKPEQMFLQTPMASQSMFKTFFQKLDRHFTAIAFAEAGDLDAVKEILQQNRRKALGQS